jgi:hypothetical protein
VIRVVALVLLLGYAGQGVVDSVWCPDGCQENLQPRTSESSQTAVPGVCLFCGTGFVVTSHIAPMVPVPAATPAAFAHIDLHSSQQLHPIDHPPRAT